MYKTIVLALDGSEGSARAVPHAVELAKASAGRIVVAHVDERTVAKGDMPPAHPREEETKEAVKATVDEITGGGVSATLETAVVVLGGPGHAIAEIADEVGADLIVVGTRGHSPVPGLALGSVAHRLLHIAHRPVLAIPPAA
jgi:nucleotide-binding universal stress UspA family protein